MSLLFVFAGGGGGTPPTPEPTGGVGTPIGLLLSLTRVPPRHAAGQTGGGRYRRRISEREWQEKQQRGFSRKYFDELKAAELALVALEARAEEARKESEKVALWDAVAAADAAIEAAQEQEQAAYNDLIRLTAALNAAANATKLATTMRQANLTVAIAEGMRKKLEEDADEEDAIMLLLH